MSGKKKPDYLNVLPKYDFADSSIRQDRVLLVKRKKSGILSTWSNYFRDRFNKSGNTEILIEDTEPEEITVFLNYIYPGDSVIAQHNYIQLINLAYRFEAPVIQKKCGDFIQKNFDHLDKLELLETALKNDLVDIKIKLGKYFGDETVSVSSRCYHGCVTATHCNTHSNKFIIDGFALNKNSYLSQNIDRIVGLSPEAKGFIFDQILQRNCKKDNKLIKFLNSTNGTAAELAVTTVFAGCFCFALWNSINSHLLLCY